MSFRQLTAFYLSLVVVSSLIAAGWALNGAWMVLPFCGIELVALGIALLLITRRLEDYEKVSLTAHELIVEVAVAGSVKRTPLSRHWVRVETGGPERQRVVLAVHDRKLVLGRFVGDEERRQFGQELRSALAK